MNALSNQESPRKLAGCSGRQPASALGMAFDLFFTTIVILPVA
jgi:hypothetical protein